MANVANSQRQPYPIRAVLSWLLCLGFAWISAEASATNWFVRSDGGDISQCNGRSNTPYPGSGTAQACAWKHPFMALPPGGPARIQGGDTLLIGSGSYRMGQGAPGATICNPAWSWDCHMTKVPSGPSPSQPTRILGAGHDTGCSAAPELWGTERAAMVVNLQGSSNVELACLEITDHDSCIEHHCHGGVCSGEVDACKRDAPPWGDWASTGIKASASAKVLIRDVNVHGMANRGVLAGGLQDWTSDRLTLRGNGWSGWDGDIGSGSSNSGTLLFRELEIAWNGCGERYPGGQPFGCWGQTAGGYGDGLGTAATGGHWIFEDALVHHNTSDGIDLLYMTEGSRVTVRRGWFEGNAGNQLKTKGDARIENSVIVGNCAYFVGHANMHDGDHCRALGNSLSIGLLASSRVEVVNNTVTGQGDCLIMSGGGGSAAQLVVTNNLLMGEVDWRQPWDRSCVQYTDGGTAQLSWSRNSVSGVKNDVCPGDSLCTPPMIANPLLAAFDPEPKVGSPLINAGSSSLAPPNDYRGNARSDGSPDIGAYEYVQGGGGAPEARIFHDSFN